MWAAIKWVFYTLLTLSGVVIAVGIGAVVTLAGAALSSLAIGGAVLFVLVLAVKEYFEGPEK